MSVDSIERFPDCVKVFFFEVEAQLSKVAFVNEKSKRKSNTNQLTECAYLFCNCFTIFSRIRLFHLSHGHGERIEVLIIWHAFGSLTWYTLCVGIKAMEEDTEHLAGGWFSVLSAMEAKVNHSSTIQLCSEKHNSSTSQCLL